MSPIGVKGERDGLVVTLPAEESAEAVTEALRRHLEQAGAFFKGAQVTLEVGERLLSEEELITLRTLLEEWEVRLTALRASNEATRAAALALGLELPFVVAPGSVSHTPLMEAPDESGAALLVRRTLRSGQIVRHPHAVVVLGDVNPGAEIVAGGDVVVWGSLRGLVHAGAGGNDGALVCALKLSATQLRIGNHIAMAPEEKGKRRLRLWKRLQQGPELARVQQGAIVVEAWSGKPLDR